MVIYTNNDELSIFIDELGDFGMYDSKSPYFYGWKSIKVYYDNGQVELSKILSSTFNIMLSEITFKKVMPKDYKLFQVADLF